MKPARLGVLSHSLPSREERLARLLTSPLLSLRQGMDHQSVTRKTFLVDRIETCERCGGTYFPSEAKKGHTREECEAFIASSVLES